MSAPVALERRTRQSRRTWTVLALIVYALSRLHVALAAVLIPLPRRTGPTR